MSVTERAAVRLFRRMVIELQPSAPTRLLETAARFAQRFDSELSAVYLEDLRLLEWAAAPIGRQFSRACTPSRLASPDQLACDFSAAASMLRRRLSGVTSRLGVTARFEVARATLAGSAPYRLDADDLWAVIEPADPLARLSYPFTRVQAAIAGASAPVLYFPHATIERSGPVLSILGEVGDEGQRDADAGSESLGARVAQWLAAELVRTCAADLSALGTLVGREQLIVLSRRLAFSGSPEAAFARIAQRRVPVLLVGAPPAAR